MTRVDENPVLFLFAREPVEARAKTRLAPMLGAAGAARLARCMIGWSAANARANWPGPIRLALWPPQAADRFSDLPDIEMVGQRGADLGERMAAALASAPGPAAVLGSDVPHLDGAVLRLAAQRLREGLNVIGPADDGGFYLVGLARPARHLFAGVNWSGVGVLGQVLENAARLNVSFELLPPARDIDTPGDLEAVARSFAPLADFLAAERVPHG